MQRTQIYLPPRQIELLKAKALKNRTTLSGEIRILIDRGLDESGKKRKLQKRFRKLTAKNWLLSLVAKPEDIPGDIPTDLSENHDKYIYEL